MTKNMNPKEIPTRKDPEKVYPIKDPKSQPKEPCIKEPSHKKPKLNPDDK